MAINVSCKCGGSFSLKDEFAGKSLKCPKCGENIQAGLVRSDPIFDRNKFLMKQKHLSINEKYYIYNEQNEPILFVERPSHLFRNVLALMGGVICAFILLGLLIAITSVHPFTSLRILVPIFFILAFLPVIFITSGALSKKRHITFFRDDSKSDKILEVLQDKKIQFLNITFTILDASGKSIGRLHKKYIQSFLRKQWYVYNPDGALICIAMEDSSMLAMLRKLLGSFYGLLRTNFIIFDGTGETIRGEFNRKLTILDNYVLDMSQDPFRTIDRKIALALGVILDTGERR